MTRAVIDPGVLVGGVISPEGVPGRLLLAWDEATFELITSEALLGELESVLFRQKFRRYLSEDEARRFIAILRRDAHLVPDPPVEHGVTPDPKDDYLVTLARAGGADFLVSGDQHFTGLKDPDPPVLTPRAFLEAVTPPS